jgi:hypothetical protein
MMRLLWPHTGAVSDTTPPSHAHHEPPGPPVKWQTVSREWDRSGRLLSERVTTTEDADCDPEEPERHVGQYL